eukprot:6905132-Alexandrium_andersonii.AAC.1
MPLVVLTFYGWANDEGKPKSQLNDELISALLVEAGHWPQMPTVLLGDLNNDPSSLPLLRRCLEESSLVDIGAHASWWGGHDSEHTATAHGAKSSSRIDV